MSSTTINTINANSLLQDFDLFTDLYGKQSSSFQELRKLIDKIEAGTEMEILERSGEWLKVSYKKDFYILNI